MCISKPWHVSLDHSLAIVLMEVLVQSQDLHLKVPLYHFKHIEAKEDLV